MSTILRGSDGFDSYSSIRGFKNLIINGRKQVNQSGLTTTDNAYNYDNHYKVGNNWFVFIDGKNIISGEPYTVSWDGAATAGYYIGTAGATTINAQTFTPIANGETIIPTITSGQILWIKFASDASGSTYNKVQFEPGTVATPYENRLYELEESFVWTCYERSTATYMYCTVYGNDTTALYANERYVNLPFKARKRKTPIFSHNTGGTTGVTVNVDGANIVSTGESSTLKVTVSNWIADAIPY